MPFTAPATYASQANTGGASIFEIGDTASPPNYTAISEVKSFNVDAATMAQIEVTHLLSPGNTGEYIPGLLKPGTLSCSGNYIGDASQLSINTLIGGRTEFPVRIKAPVQRLAKTLTVIGTGFFSKFSIGPFEPEKGIDFQADVQLTGLSVYTVA